MRLFVMFDLPVETSQSRREYRIFHKALINEGFIMMQESIYTRITVNRKAAELLEQRLMKQLPKEGLVQTLIVTEAQFSSMHFLVGQSSDDIRNNPERVIVI
ncbi:CRISPR-associated endonuclease Cas2 [Periweissella beninensis]|uniref:CRISPR-associated endoribonuclease Cas2 n=1 Tax=Periweissella beninensis TaxID=504936 RepID=A0ABT0VGW8_9LACO|nr:CRISPR-associated endonuclease Cas2 [Periweissella beninensis]MBM7544651.1 CRISPR-associated protein Cas2 [Periweissella beninensis]MCM2436906.1 CRISPR-associated endonuclease Cas2 [Periweissella beninensis]MCT4396582.1 CRISPR-associated endonuclease Cas2 [Periweissella beninensis]